MSHLKQLWLHIGYPKTGTSFLQAALQHNKNVLLRQGVLYPDTGRLGGGHALLAFPLLSEERKTRADVNRPDVSLDRGLWDALKEENATAGGPAAVSNVVLSSEYFSEAESVPELGEICGALAETTKVIVYLRRQDELVESGYNQSVKAGLTTKKFSLDGIGRRYDWYEVLERWRAVFGGDNLVVRTYDRQTVDRGIVKDFCEIVGIDIDSLSGGRTNANERLHPFLVEYQRIANELGFRGSGLASKISESLDREASFLAAEERHSILQKYAESNAKVAREYLGRPDGRLFDPVSEDRPVAPRQFDPKLMVQLLEEWWRSKKHE